MIQGLRNDGQPCGNFTNTSFSEYCVYHAMSEARKLSSKRVQAKEASFSTGTIKPSPFNALKKSDMKTTTKADERAALGQIMNSREETKEKCHNPQLGFGLQGASDINLLAKSKRTNTDCAEAARLRAIAILKRKKDVASGVNNKTGIKRLNGEETASAKRPKLGAIENQDQVAELLKRKSIHDKEADNLLVNISVHDACSKLARHSLSSSWGRFSFLRKRLKSCSRFSTSSSSTCSFRPHFCCFHEALESFEKAGIDVNFPVAEAAVCGGLLMARNFLSIKFLIIGVEHSSFYSAQEHGLLGQPHLWLHDEDAHEHESSTNWQSQVRSHSGSDEPESMLGSVLLVLALSLHALFEGLSLAVISDASKLLEVFAALILHKCIIGFSLGVRLVQSGMRTPWIALCTACFSVQVLIGGLGGMSIMALISGGKRSTASVVSSVLQVFRCPLQVGAVGWWTLSDVRIRLPGGLSVHVDICSLQLFSTLVSKPFLLSLGDVRIEGDPHCFSSASGKPSNENFSGTRSSSFIGRLTQLIQYCGLTQGKALRRRGAAGLLLADFALLFQLSTDVVDFRLKNIGLRVADPTIAVSCGLLISGIKDGNSFLLKIFLDIYAYFTAYKSYIKYIFMSTMTELELGVDCLCFSAPCTNSIDVSFDRHHWGHSIYIGAALIQYSLHDSNPCIIIGIDDCKVEWSDRLAKQLHQLLRTITTNGGSEQKSYIVERRLSMKAKAKRAAIFVVAKELTYLLWLCDEWAIESVAIPRDVVISIGSSRLGVSCLILILVLFVSLKDLCAELIVIQFGTVSGQYIDLEELRKVKKSVVIPDDGNEMPWRCWNQAEKDNYQLLINLILCFKYGSADVICVSINSSSTLFDIIVSSNSPVYLCWSPLLHRVLYHMKEVATNIFDLQQVDIPKTPSAKALQLKIITNKDVELDMELPRYHRSGHGRRIHLFTSSLSSSILPKYLMKLAFISTFNLITSYINICIWFQFINCVKWIKIIHQMKKIQFTAESPLPSDIRIAFKEVRLEMEDDPFENLLQTSHELKEDEICLESKMDELYASLLKKNSAIYVERWKKAGGNVRRHVYQLAVFALKIIILIYRSLFVTRWTSWEIRAFADISLHGTDKCIQLIHEFDPLRLLIYLFFSRIYKFFFSSLILFFRWLHCLLMSNKCWKIIKLL
uniref:Zf-primase domain-containing protein n=1 Tax=Heterorhabditis bacteriophora TaxID=37862 RepID=A0A1I7WTM7_HETBA